MTIYRKVKVSERLPEIGVQVFIRSDEDFWTSVGYIDRHLEWVSSWDEDCVIYPEYWLEEIELPTEEEIKEASEDNFCGYSNEEIFQEGTNYILNKIKG